MDEEGREKPTVTRGNPGMGIPDKEDRFPSHLALQTKGAKFCEFFQFPGA